MYTLGLDVSTSKIGVALYDDDNDELILLTHVVPYHNIKDLDEFDDLYLKARLLGDFFKDKSYIQDIHRVIIEEPLIKSRTPKVAAKLNRFAGFVYSVLKEVKPDMDIKYISVNNARKHAFPELVKKGRVFATIPSKIGDLDVKKLKDYKKNVILNLVSQRFPNIKWKTTTHNTLNDCNYDMADAVTVILGYKIKNKEIEPFIGDIDLCLDFLMAQNEFKLYCDVLNESDLNHNQKKEKRKQFLIEHFDNNKLLKLNLTN